MSAAVYAREIREQYDCGECAANSYTWDERGRCLGPILDNGNPAVVHLRMDGPTYPAGAEYPEDFATCPMGLLRADLRPRETAVASIVSHAAAAEVDKRYPAIPARLSSLIGRWRLTENSRLRAEHEASVRGIEERRGHR